MQRVIIFPVHGADSERKGTEIPLIQDSFDSLNQKRERGGGKKAIICR